MTKGDQTIDGRKTLSSNPLLSASGATGEVKPEKHYIFWKFQDMESFADEAAVATQAGITVTGLGCSVEATNAISGSKSLELVTTVTATDNVAFDITVSDNFDYGKPLYFGLKTRGSTGYVANDMYAVITEDGTELAHTIVNIPAGDYQVKGFFIPVSGKTYRLKIKNDITTAGHVLVIDDLYVGTQENLYVNSVTDWVIPQVNPVLYYGTTAATNVNTVCRYQATGNSYIIRMYFTFTGAANASVALRITLPDSLAIDNLKVASF
jgi:hypothetical protein